MTYVSFPWPPLEATQSIFNSIFRLKKQVLEKGLIKMRVSSLAYHKLPKKS